MAQGPLRINIEHLAKTYGFKGPVKAHILVDWENHGPDLLVLEPIPEEVLDDLAVIRAIGTKET